MEVSSKPLRNLSSSALEALDLPIVGLGDELALGTAEKPGEACIEPENVA